MALRIANPSVVAKVEKLARRTGLSKTAVVEQAVDRMLAEAGVEANEVRRRAASLLDQLDRLPDRLDAVDPLDWDDHGVPR